MYLSSYTFTGDPADLTARFDRLLPQFRDELVFHVAVVTADGLVTYDGCPDRATAEAFSTSPEWAAALASVGLPTPAVAGLGEVHFALARQSVPV